MRPGSVAIAASGARADTGHESRSRSGSGLAGDVHRSLEPALVRARERAARAEVAAGAGHALEVRRRRGAGTCPGSSRCRRPDRAGSSRCVTRSRHPARRSCGIRPGPTAARRAARRRPGRPRTCRSRRTTTRSPSPAAHEVEEQRERVRPAAVRSGAHAAVDPDAVRRRRQRLRARLPAPPPRADPGRRPRGCVNGVSPMSRSTHRGRGAVRHALEERDAPSGGRIRARRHPRVVRAGGGDRDDLEARPASRPAPRPARATTPHRPSGRSRSPQGARRRREGAGPVARVVGGHRGAAGASARPRGPRRAAAPDGPASWAAPGSARLDRAEYDGRLAAVEPALPRTGADQQRLRRSASRARCAGSAHRRACPPRRRNVHVLPARRRASSAGTRAAAGLRAELEPPPSTPVVGRAEHPVAPRHAVAVGAHQPHLARRRRPAPAVRARRPAAAPRLQVQGRSPPRAIRPSARTTARRRAIGAPPRARATLTGRRRWRSCRRRRPSGPCRRRRVPRSAG